MILYIFSFGNGADSWSSDFALACTRAPNIHEAFLSAKKVTVKTGADARDFVQVAFKPKKPEPFVGPSSELSFFLVQIGKRFDGTLHSVSVTSTERNPLRAEVPSFD